MQRGIGDDRTLKKVTTGSGKGDEMNTELRDAIEALEKEKNIMRETLFEAIENALLTACKSNFGKVDNIAADSFGNGHAPLLFWKKKMG